MCRIASLFLLQNLKGSMSDDARDFNNFLRGKAPKEIHAILTETWTIVCHRQKLGGPV